MRKVLTVYAAISYAILTPGCYAPCASTGWRFEVGRPAVFSSPGLVQQTNGPLAVSPLGTTLPPIIDGIATTAQAAIRSSVTPHILGRTRPTGEDCTMEDVCAALRRIEMRLGQPPAQPLPMPRAGPAPE